MTQHGFGTGNPIRSPHYASFAGWTLIITGVFHLAFGLMGTIYLTMLDASWFSASDAWYSTLGLRAGADFTFADLLAAYLIAQAFLGWILGLVTIWAGKRTLNGRSRKFVQGVAIANLLFFPLGTTVGSFILMGLPRAFPRDGSASPAR